MDYAVPGAYGVKPGGLSGEYFDDVELKNLVLTRIDPMVDFEYGESGPAGGLPADDFSERWQGYVHIDADGEYTFYVRTDDGARLWVDDKLIIDTWIGQAPTEHTAVASLKAGWRPIKLEHYEGEVTAVIQLFYSSATITKQIIPSDKLGTMGYAQSSERTAWMTATHEHRLTGLKPGTTYHYRIRCQDAARNVVLTEDATFEH